MKKKSLFVLTIALLILVFSSSAMAIIDPGNPPMNPDGSFPDGVKANIIEGNWIEIYHPNPPGFKYVNEKDEPQYPLTIPNKITVFVNSQEIEFPDQQPYIDASSRTMVPVRFVAEALGAEIDADKDGIVTIKQGELIITHKIGTNTIIVNGATKTFDTKSVLTKQYRTMVPLRFVSEALGARVGWNAETWTATVELTYDTPENLEPSQDRL